MPLSDGISWRLNRHLKFEDDNGDLHVVHRSFVTDFASIPDLSKIASLTLLGCLPIALYASWTHFVCLLAWICALIVCGLFIGLVAYHFNHNDLLDAPAVLHDDGYRRPRLGHWPSTWRMKLYWDWVFLSAMKANGVSPFVRWSCYIAVSLFGWHAWRRKHSR
jgi:hypothetical protein